MTRVVRVAFTNDAQGLDRYSDLVQSGDVLAHRFEIDRLAGTGGMSCVYRATDRTTGTPVAIKILTGEEAAKGTARFEREIALLRELEHPNVVGYVADGMTPEGTAYLAMEWLEGEDLADRLATGPLGLAPSLALIAKIAEPLAHAHAHGIVHRDLKPSNVFLSDRALDRIKLLDFGVARAGGREKLTGTGAIVGTPAYMAPEQARGDRAITPASDVFSLGCILFECISGKSPFAGEHLIAILGQILFGDAPRLRELVSDVPPVVDDLVARMLSRDPLRRPADAAALRAELAALDERVPISLEPPSALTAGEQRVVCVVVASPANELGATLLTSDSHDATSVHEQLRAAATSRGGQLELLANGAVVATFGGAAPSDEVARAASCALEVKAILASTPVVLFTGRAVVGGRAPVGDVIGRAARALSQTAPSKGVLIDSTTAGLLPGRFVVAETGGDLVLSEVEDQGAERRLLGRPTSCLGRDRELSTLRGTLTECIEEQVARAMLVTASPGTGKSRLVQELVRGIRANEDVAILVGRSDPLGGSSPFGVIAHAIRETAGISPSDRLEAKLEKLRTRVARHVPSTDQQRLVELLAELADVRVPDSEASRALISARADPLLMRDALRGAVADWLAYECEAGPLLLLLEDLHWSDGPSVRLVESLLRTLSERPLLVVATARPEVHTTFPDLWVESGVSEMRLGMLGKKSSERLVREALGASASNDVVAQLVERAGGHPFFLEELVRAVAEGGDPSALPDTVLGMLQARLDALGAETKRILRAASIFGETFWAGGVGALVGQEPNVRELLVELVTKEIVEQRSSSTIPGETELGFRHALVRDAAYAMLTDTDRKLGHRLAGRWLESVEPDLDARAHLLAHHLSKAGAWLEAVDYARKASARAAHFGRFPEALAIVEQAREWSARVTSDDGAASKVVVELLLEKERLTDTLGDRIRQQATIDELIALTPDDAALTTAYTRQGELQMLLGNTEAGTRSFERALDLARTSEDLRAERAALRSMAFVAWQKGEWDDAIRHHEHLLEIDEVLDDDDGRAHDKLHLAMSLLRAGHLERARALAESSELLSARVPKNWSPFLHFQAVLAAQLGDVEGQLAFYRRALEIQDEHGLLPYKLITLIAYATALCNNGRTEEGLDVHRQAIALARETGFGAHLARAHRALAAILVALDRGEEALPHLQEATVVLAKLGDREGEAEAWSALAQAHERFATNDARRRAIDAWERARGHWQKLQRVAAELEAVEGIGRCKRALGDDAAAVRSYEAALALAQSSQDRKREGALWNTLGIIDWNAGRLERALERYENALAVFDALEDDAHRALILNSLGATLNRLGKKGQAREHLRRGAEVARGASERLLEGHALALLGDVCSDEGERDQARLHYEASLALRKDLGDRRGEGWMLQKLAQLHAHESRNELARELALQAEVLADEIVDSDLKAATRKTFESLGS